MTETQEQQKEHEYEAKTAAQEYLPTPERHKTPAVVILSGGLDSTVLLYYARKYHDVYAISFDYGQRHRKELRAAIDTCMRLVVPHEIVDISGLQHLLKSTLTGHGKVPHGHYAEGNMRATVVPNRNAIMLAIAYGWARSIGARTLLIGAHAGDHPIYPDCRESFFTMLEAAFNLGSGDIRNGLQIETPFVGLTKADIVSAGKSFGVPFADTWSCYEGGEVHCGRCGTCVERAEAFALARVTDPTVYADKDYWKTVTPPVAAPHA